MCEDVVVVVVPQIPLEVDEEVLQDRGCTMAFHDEFMVFKREGRWNIKNKDTNVLQEKNFFNEVVIHKNRITYIEIFFKTTISKFVLNIEDIHIPFKTRKECLELFNAVIKWRYGVPNYKKTE